MIVTCPYCSQPAELVSGNIIYPHRNDLSNDKFWLCKPCDAYVGCHKPSYYVGNTNNIPLGRLANKELRYAKSNAHYAFDSIWKKGYMDRTRAYDWLSKQMSLDPDLCHIGMFDVEQCKQVVTISNKYFADRKKRNGHLS